MFKDLSNTELSLIYYQFKEHLDTIDNELKSRVRCKALEITIQDMDVRPFVMIPISDDEVAAIYSSHYYQTIQSVVDKLHPVVVLIEEAEPTIKTKLDE